MSLTGVLLADFSAFKNEAATSTDALKKMESGADTAATKLAKLGSGFDLKAAINDPLGTASSMVTDFAKAIGGAGSAAALTATTVVGLSGAIVALASNAAKAGAEFDDMRSKSGMSVETLSRYSMAAEVVGADMKRLVDVVFKLQEGIGNNTETFQKGLTAMGLSTAELKAAGPDKYLELVTAGLNSIADPADRAAAGTAVLGKGYRDVAGALGDLDKGLKATADLSPWTDAQVQAAKDFQMQLAEVKTRVSEAAIALGQELMPAASVIVAVLARTGEALVHIADAGGLVSGTYKALKGAMGEDALAAETANAVHEATMRLFSEQGMTVDKLAQKMLEMGYSQQTVARETGLTAEAVRKLNGEMQASKDATEQWDAVMGRVNTALAAGPPNIDAVDQATRDWVVSMKEANISLKDIQAASGLTAGQIDLITKAATEAKKSTDEWKKAMDEIRDSYAGWSDTLDTVDGKVVEAVKVGLSMGVSQEALAKAYGLTAQQVKAVVIALEEYSTAINATADFDKAAAEQRKRITQDMLTQTNDRVLAEFQKKQAAEESEAAFLKANLADAQAQDAIQQGIKTTTTAATESADVIGNAYTTHFNAAKDSFQQFQGVVVAGTAEMIAGLTSFHDSGAYVQMQKDMRDAQNARGGFYIDTGSAPPPIQTRDSGGPVVAGTSYLIGGGKAPEIFTPGATGFVTPNAVGGVHVNNVFNIVDTESNITRRVADNITRSIMAAQKL
jgi:transposase-like protein